MQGGKKRRAKEPAFESGMPAKSFLDRLYRAYQAKGVVVIRGITAAIDALDPRFRTGESSTDTAKLIQKNVFMGLAQRQAPLLNRPKFLERDKDYGYFTIGSIAPNAMDIHLHNGELALPIGLSEKAVFRRQPHLLGLGSILYEPVRGVEGDSALYLNKLCALQGDLESHLNHDDQRNNNGTIYFKPDSRATLKLPRNSFRINQRPNDFTLVLFDNKRLAHGSGFYWNKATEVPVERKLHTLWLRGDLSD
jgi:hypothetical protein